MVNAHGLLQLAVACWVVESAGVRSEDNAPRNSVLQGDLNACGISIMQGRRAQLEDRAVCHLDLLSDNTNAQLDLFAVYDGHEGNQAADFMVQHFHNNLAKAMRSLHRTPGDVCEIAAKALRAAAAETDAALLRAAEAAGTADGTTAVWALFSGQQYLIGHVGDSSAVLCSRAEAQPGHGRAASKRAPVGLEAKLLTADHTPGRPDERARIRRAGGSATRDPDGKRWRLQGELAVSRAFGDAPYRQHGLTAEPCIAAWQPVSDHDQFLILASDGLYEAFSPADACALAGAIAEGVDSPLLAPKTIAIPLGPATFEAPAAHGSAGSFSNYAAALKGLTDLSKPGREERVARKAVQSSRSASQPQLQPLRQAVADALVAAAYTQGSGDNLAALVVDLQPEKPALPAKICSADGVRRRSAQTCGLEAQQACGEGEGVAPAVVASVCGVSEAPGQVAVDRDESSQGVDGPATWALDLPQHLPGSTVEATGTALSMLESGGRFQYVLQDRIALTPRQAPLPHLPWLPSSACIAPTREREGQCLVNSGTEPVLTDSVLALAHALLSVPIVPQAPRLAALEAAGHGPVEEDWPHASGSGHVLPLSRQDHARAAAPRASQQAGRGLRNQPRAGAAAVAEAKGCREQGVVNADRPGFEPVAVEGPAPAFEGVSHPEYRLGRQFARGGFGEVWRAVRRRARPWQSSDAPQAPGSHVDMAAAGITPSAPAATVADKAGGGAWESLRAVLARWTAGLCSRGSSHAEDAQGLGSKSQDDGEVFVLKRVLAERGEAARLAGLREAYFGTLLGRRPELLQGGCAATPACAGRDHLVRFVEAFQAGPDFWLVFHDEGTSIHDLMYSAEAPSHPASGRKPPSSSSSIGAGPPHGPGAPVGPQGSTPAGPQHSASQPALVPGAASSQGSAALALDAATAFRAEPRLGGPPPPALAGHLDVGHRPGGGVAADIVRNRRTHVAEPSEWWWALRRGPGGEEQLRDIVRQMLLALAAVHATNVTHRDVKPENLLGRAGRSGSLHVRLIDFGSALDAHSIAHLYGPNGPSSDEQSAGYAPPEALLGRYDSDHALGYMLERGRGIDVLTGTACARTPEDSIWHLPHP